jgi:hypothetical protein
MYVLALFVLTFPQFTSKSLLPPSHVQLSIISFPYPRPLELVTVDTALDICILLQSDACELLVDHWDFWDFLDCLD